MHSSRLHTARSLTIGLGGGCTCPGVYLAGGTCLGGTCPGVYLPGEGVYLPRGTCWHRVYLPRGVYLPESCIWYYLYAASTPTECQHLCSSLYSVTQVHAGIQPPPPVNRMTDRCKNITLPQASFAGGKYSPKQVFRYVYKRRYSSSPFTVFSVTQFPSTTIVKFWVNISHISKISPTIK